jgi:hypothetical protein
MQRQLSHLVKYTIESSTPRKLQIIVKAHDNVLLDTSLEWGKNPMLISSTASLTLLVLQPVHGQRFPVPVSFIAVARSTMLPRNIVNLRGNRN